MSDSDDECTYYVLTHKGKCYFDIENSKICNVKNFWNILGNSMPAYSKPNETSSISQNFLFVYLDSGHYREYAIFENKTNKLAKLN